MRDINSYIRYNSSLNNSISYFKKLKEQGYNFCSIPPFFTIFLPSTSMKLNFNPTITSCNEKLTVNNFDLIQNSGSIINDKICTKWPIDNGKNILSHIFKSDSGYSYYICSHSAVKEGISIGSNRK